MKKAILNGLRWGMDAGFLFSLTMFLVILFYTGLATIGFGLRVVTEDFFIWCVLPLLVGAITGAVFSFILVTFRPNKRIYISICTIMGMTPMYPSIFSMIRYISRENASGLFSIIAYYILYLVTCILLSNYIYKKNAVISNDNSSAA